MMIYIVQFTINQEQNSWFDTFSMGKFGVGFSA